MKKEDALTLLKREYDNLEYNWTSKEKNEMKIVTQRAIDFFKQFAGQTPKSSNILHLLFSFHEKNMENESQRELIFGYVYGVDEIEDFIKNPDTLWQMYESTKDKQKLLTPPYLRYTTNKKENKRMFLRDVFYIIFGGGKFTPEMIERLSEKYRDDTNKKIVELYRGEGKKKWEEMHRKPYIEEIQKIVKMLEWLGCLENTRKRHNDNWRWVDKINLKRTNNEQNPNAETFFDIKENVPNVDDVGKIFGIDLSKCSIFQLEAILSFFMNRLEKERESLGTGMFFLSEQLIDSQINNGDISWEQKDEMLKKLWKKQKIISKLIVEAGEKLHDEAVSSEIRRIKTSTGDELYEKYLSMYEDAYKQLFPESKETFYETIKRFLLSNALSKHNEYLKKDRLMEDLVLHCNRENVNWGIMEENYGIQLKKKVLIGIDVPGLNMPIRLHYPLENLQDLMKNYLGETEIPIYVGSKDFDVNGIHRGTALLLPFTQKQNDIIKKVSRAQSVISKDDETRIKHLACIQLPNTARKLLEMKTNKKQSIPDYINLFTGKIRRVERKNNIDLDEENR